MTVCPCNDPEGDVTHSTGLAHTTGMNTTTRSDVHRPSAIVAADYRFVDVLDLQAEHWHPAERELLEETERRYVGDHAKTWRCSVCGAGVRYACIWEHVPSGGYIVTGQDCADGISTIAAAEARDRAGVLAAAAAELRHEQRSARRREEWAAEAPENAEAILTLGRLSDEALRDEFLGSLSGQLRRKGELSRAQVAALPKAIAKLGERLERAARDAASEHFGSVGVRGTYTLTLLNKPEGRDGDYGTTYAHVLADEAGNIAIWYASGLGSPWYADPLEVDADGHYQGRRIEGAGWQTGSAVTVAATVKRHEERNGRKATVLTRLRRRRATSW